MTYSQLLKCLAKTNFSAEILADYFAVSNMTIRRWQSKKNVKIPKTEIDPIVQGLYRLIADGYLSVEDQDVRAFISHDSHNYMNAVVKSLGITSAFSTSSEAEMPEALGQIGSSDAKRTAVDKGLEKIKGFRKLGSEWKQKITFLLNVLKNKKMTLSQKAVAYGALFYLLTPFDFIPDYIPVFGMMDDYAVLGFAILYYLKNFPTEVAESNNKIPKENESNEKPTQELQPSHE